MSNQSLCQPQIMNYDFMSQDSKLALASTENVASNQQQLLEQLLFALTNQLAIAAANQTNLGKGFAPFQSIFSDLKQNDKDITVANNKISNNSNNKNAYVHNRQMNFQRNSLSNKKDNNIQNSETSINNNKNSKININESTKQKMNELINIESINLDTHLDLNRFMYFNNEKNVTESDKTQSQQQVLPVIQRQISLDQDNNSNNCLTIDCNLVSSSSCQLSSSSCSSSCSSISNICKSKLNTEQQLTIDKPNNEAINKLNIEALNKKRPISYLANSKLSKHFSSSSDCLSGDEGYFGSYSDTKNLNQDQQKSLNGSSVSQQEQVILLKYLLQNQHITQSNNLNDPLKIISDNNNNIKPINPIGHDDVYDESNAQIPCLNIFRSAQKEEDEFTSLLSDSNIYEDFLYSDRDESGKFDISYFLSKYEKNFNRHKTGEVLDSLQVKEEIIQILNEQEMQRLEKERLEEIEMRSLNWRRLLDQRAREEKIRDELSKEDDIDGNAYLNEIEMNIDHFQSGDIFIESDGQDPEDMLVDTLLKFRTNKMAFNLRKYHQSIEQEFERKRLDKETQENNFKMNVFANFHVDSIPEFTPYSTQDQFYDYEEQDQIEYDGEDYDQTYIEQHPADLEMNQMYDEFEVDSQYHMHETDYTMINEESSEVYDENGYLISCAVGGNNLDHYEVEDLVDTVELAESAESEFLYEEDYEDYEDQLMIDSLSEQDALNLLRNESEMYALQMAQASKSGLLPKSKSSKKKKGRYNSGNSSVTTQSTDTNTSESKSDITSSNVDIFENVFNFDEVIRHNPNIDSNSELASSSASISGATENENFTSENFDLEINEFFMPNLHEQNTGTGNISMSLRNSLLKLRHTRRHLAKLIDSKKPSSGSSSTSSSLTNSSGTPLGAQFSKQITISALSRKPCVYMLNEGRCMRADCRFAHDLKQITCKYWIDGECLKGENCEFLHEMIEETTPQSSKNSKKAQKTIAIKKKDFKLDTEEFPALGSAPNTIQNVPKPAEFPPLGASPVSTTAANSPNDSIKKAPETSNSKTPPSISTVVASKPNLVIKTAASVLKTAPAANAVNLVQNKPQSIATGLALKSQKVATASQLTSKASNTQSQKLKKSESPSTPKQQQIDRKSRDQAKSQNLAALSIVKTNKVTNSCGSSSCSSSSSSSSSRGNSTVRNKINK